jgi:hypothetical protein
VLRLLPLILCATLGIAAEGLLVSRPAAIDELLIRVSRGEHAALSAANPAWFSAAYAREQADGTLVHWTIDLQRAIAQAPAPAQPHLATALSALYQHDITTALRFVPAPQALADLCAAADHLVDRGRFDAYLDLARDLDRWAPGWETARPQRRSAILALSTSSSPLAAPGALIHCTVIPPLGQDHSYGWQVSGDLLLRRDPWGGLLWQRPLPPGQRQILPHNDHTVVVTAQHLLTITNTGSQRITPRGGHHHLLGSAGGRLWFAHGSDIAAFDPRDGSHQRLTLAQPAVCPPLCHKRQTLWLTNHEVLLYDDQRLVARYAHSLSHDWQEPRWHWHDGRPLLTDGGQAWLIAPPPGADDLAGLVAADRFDEVLAHGAAAGVAGQQALLGSATLDNDRVRTALTWSDDPYWHLRLLHAASQQQQLSADLASHLAQLCAQHSTIELPVRSHADPLAPAAAWPHLLRADLLIAQQHVLTPAPGHLAPEGPAQQNDIWRRSQQGDWQRGSTTLHYHLNGHHLDISATDGRGRRWRQRLTLGSGHRAGLWLQPVGEQIVIDAGDGRLRVLGEQTGTLLADQPSRGHLNLSSCHALLDGRLAVLNPTTLHLIGDQAQNIPLPHRPRWSAVCGNDIIIADDAGLRAWPDGRLLTWPKAIANAPHAPNVNGHGVTLDNGRFWPWPDESINAITPKQ